MSHRLIKPIRHLYNQQHKFYQSLYTISKSKNTNTSHLLIEAEPRRFNNIRIDLSLQNEHIFDKQLEYSLSYWKNDGIRAVWAYVPTYKSQLIPSLIKREFDFHHAVPGYVLLSKWMSPSPSKLPHAPSSQIGVAGVVMNNNEEILVVQENHTWVERKWKFPGGLTDNQENINDGVCREIYEETGIKCDFKSIIGFRQQHGVKLGGSHSLISDFYVVCRLVALHNDINKDPSEIYDAKWIKLKEFLEIDTWPINMEFAQILYDSLEIYKKENNINNITDINDVKLRCDWTMRQLDSVSVPGSKYNLYHSD